MAMSLFESIINSTVAEFQCNITKLLKDKNTIPVNINDPPKKKAISYPIHKLVFGKAFACKFNADEKVSPTHYEIKSLPRFVELFGITFNKYNDIAVSCPVMVATHDTESYKRGDLVLPLRNEEDGNVSVFFPGVHEDDGMEAIPFSKFLSTKDWRDKLDIFPERVIHNYTLYNIVKGEDYVTVKTGSGVQIGDYIVVRGKSYEVYALSDNAFTKCEGQEDVIRIVGEFTNNEQEWKWSWNLRNSIP